VSALCSGDPSRPFPAFPARASGFRRTEIESDGRNLAPGYASSSPSNPDSSRYQHVSPRGRSRSNSPSYRGPRRGNDLHLKRKRLSADCLTTAMRAGNTFLMGTFVRKSINNFYPATNARLHRPALARNIVNRCAEMGRIYLSYRFAFVCVYVRYVRCSMCTDYTVPILAIVSYRVVSRRPVARIEFYITGRVPRNPLQFSIMQATAVSTDPGRYAPRDREIKPRSGPDDL
jgi:hypothetical protein